MHPDTTETASSILLGLTHRLTELLPISSSGHLLLVRSLLGYKTLLLFDVLLHVATLLVIALYFRRTLSGVVRALASLDFNSEYSRLLLLIAIGNVPTALMGLLFYDLYSQLFASIQSTALCLVA